MKFMKKIIVAILMTVTMQVHAQWTGTWAAAAEFTGPGDMPASTLANRSLREIIHVSLGGNELRLKLSNEFSKEPVEILSLYIADALEGWEIQTKTAKYLTFGGKKNVTIEPGKAIYSDVIRYSLKPLQRLSITINYGQGVPVNATSHRGSRTTSYIIPGVSKPKSSFAEGEKVDHWYNIAALDVKGALPCVAVLGNSITDGRGSTTNKQNRWPDFLAEALQGQVGVLNLGIGGNSVVEGGLSEPAVKRFERDILDQSGLSALIIFEGVNDLGNSRHVEQTTAKLVNAYERFIKEAKDKGMKVYLATITPFKGNGYHSYYHEAGRQYINDWIRNCKRTDGIIDFDQLVRDENEPDKLKKEYSEDWLHLNPAGYEAMGKYAASMMK